MTIYRPPASNRSDSRAEAGRTPGRGTDRGLMFDASHDLPLDLSGFVGRTQEIVEVATLLGASPVVTLTGPSGIGKTRLAVEVAIRIGETYSGGAWFVDLAPLTDAELVAQAAASALGLTPEPGRDPLDMLCSHLQRRTALLVLDNCEHVIHACARLAGRLSSDCTGLSLLTTSQRPLGAPTERTYTVSALSLVEPGASPSIASALGSEAINLFCARAMASGGGFRLTEETLPAVAEICRRLDGIPLAIELAAARTSVLGPVEIAERLGNRFSLLTRGDAAGPERHQTLRASLDWTYELLTDEEAAVLRRLSVFAGGASLGAVEDVCAGSGIDRDVVVDLLGSLVSKSLVAIDTGRGRARYHLLETIRAYAWERLEEAAETDFVCALHARWCIGFVERTAQERADGGAGLWAGTIEADHDNLRAALDWAADADAGLALRLAVGLTPFWKSRGYLREGQHWLQRIFESPALVASDGDSSPAPLALRARGLWCLGFLAILQADVSTARRAVQQSRKLARETNFERAEAQALSLLGFIAIFTQDASGAKPLLEESLRIARASGARAPVAAALSLLGRAHLFLGEIDQARNVFEESLAWADEGEGVLIGLACTALAAGEEHKARELFDSVLPRLCDDDERFETALVLSYVGELSWAGGELGLARSQLEEGLELARAMGSPFPLVRCLTRLAEIAHMEGDFDTAATLIDEACEVSREACLPYARVRCLLARGRFKLAAGTAAGAKGDYDEALQVARSSADPDGVARSLYRLAAIARLQGVDDEALALLHEALKLQAQNGTAGIPASMEAIAGLGTAQGRCEYSARIFGAAEALRRADGAERRPDEVAAYEADVARLRDALEPTSLAQAWAEGAELSRDDAVALALRGRGTRDTDRPTRGWASLTATERQVVELVAQGLTNSEIGERLFISDRTVQGHLSRVFPKVGVTSRRELSQAANRTKGGLF